MQILSTIKAFGEASVQCLASPTVTQEDKKTIEDMRNFLQYSYYATKFVIVLGFIKFVDWKRPAPIHKRQIPCAFVAFGLCAAADYLSYRYAFGQTESILVKYTGFRDGVYVNPDKFANMRKSFENKGGRVYQLDKDDLIE